ncbi:MAG: RNA degradosome polyphosphate kinase [Leuconostoc gelidum]|jgi:polyphosphate kinase|uniref:Polyphosphate kinase n=1 Tax=Leuconostoc gelidum subsp. gelidum TaxID=1607839 RepID=A0AB35G0G9_LEUGE|nr:RNA degradosome polyphosphate kinase [Leuconostoc gelidum]MBZ5963431.1 RNA degradosome polyphosphate kinase [Leuconostoc gelidum subsp. gelidum]MBZ5974581.1 RNA degradosome polyphosphate kinase [Leuconostoc gelidum subsp. gelidum]MBZ5976817.1 RNA degradosome polyphosphate kinase [Leuconostoc gelidum subsp. gelidum]MBZ5979284.1 RNA degradosome polyphosphate kinase [Leuconostoc gelidum subsp. gelidum]MBZ5986008.1 RNA degradosome polyphosphate kinase [Leuconostoc gelidum subsp. gelidum]
MVDFKRAKYYVNREISWLAFNDRVLEEARDVQNPLFERANFLAITQKNMDEWFMVRVASLQQQVMIGHDRVDAAGLTPTKQLDEISKVAGEQIKKQYQVLTRSLLPALRREGFEILHADDLTANQIQFLKRFFDQELLPVLTPMAVDTTRPFPFLANDTLNIGVRLKKSEDKIEKYIAVLQVPETSGRVIALPEKNQYILIEDIVQLFLPSLFPGYVIRESTVFHVIRDMELDIADDEDTPNILQDVQSKLQERERGRIIRVIFSRTTSSSLRIKLIKLLHVDESRAYMVNGPIDLTFLNVWLKFIHAPDLKFPPFKGYNNPNLAPDKLFNSIKHQDYLLHHPYDSFKPVIEFIQTAAKDDQVLAIKMTLYRVSGKSPIVKALGEAAQRGKQVTVLVEIKARFDEENNVHWARELERQGVHVVYGLRGLKTHAKVVLVVRREDDTIRRYVHLGTGNYNDVTANFYTDLGLLTSDSELGADVASIFNILTGYSDPGYFHQLHMSPDGIREFIYEQIDNEIANAKAGKAAGIKMKFNSLSDERMIRHLYQASQAGVKVSLIIRGITMLKVGIPEVSETIEVHSIVGRFLEHSRIYSFENDGNPKVYLSSADLMTRNLDRRVELLFPLKNDRLRDKVLSIFQTMWHDNVKTRVLQQNGSFEKKDRRGVMALDAQEMFTQDILVQQNNQMKQEQLAATKQRFEPLNNPFINEEYGGEE